jgi:aryl-alcohol dehydrogenase-like predicted oxidoreductase
VHRPDYCTDVEETLGVLTDLVRQGKIRAFGCSSFPVEDIVDSHHVAERRGLMRFRTEQPAYSLLARGIEADVLPACQRHRLGVLTWSPLAFGFLSGKYRKGGAIDLTRGRPAVVPARFDPALAQNTAKFDALEQLIDLAGGLGCTLPELALAFVTTHPAVTSAIIGPRTPDHLDSALQGASLTLDDAVLDRIDEIVPPGTDLYDPLASWPPPALATPALRRRPLEDRAAA